MNRYILIINGTAHIINEDCISNWDEINISLKRNDFSGIIRSFSSKFEFAGKAYNVVINTKLSFVEFVLFFFVIKSRMAYGAGKKNKVVYYVMSLLYLMIISCSFIY